MSIKTTKQYRVKFSDQLVKSNENKLNNNATTSDQAQQNDRNYHQNFVNLPVVDRIIDIPVIHSKNDEFYSNRKHFRDDYASYNSNQRVIKNYRSNSHDRMLDKEETRNTNSNFKISGIIPLKKNACTKCLMANTNYIAKTSN